MALSGYLKLKGQKTGDIRGSVTQKGREGKIAVIAASHEITSPRDATSGMATGRKPLHKPFVITKEVDRSSPLLYGVLAGNEGLTEWELQFFAPLASGAGAGGQVNHYTVKLTNASIASIAFRMLNNRDPELATRAEYEEIAFNYQKIEWIWVDGNITATESL